jgi:uncharacterized protein
MTPAHLQKLARPLAIAIWLAAQANPPASAQTTPQDNPRMTERTVSVTASGHVSAAPDLASISTGIQTEAPTARDAMTLNTAAMIKLIEGLKAQGIASKDIQSTSITVTPRYTNPRDGKQPAINGYTATNQVRLVVRDLNRAGDILDAALTLGATQMGGIAFEVSTAEKLKDEARKDAMTNARRRAELFAAAAGASVGQVISISEDVQGHASMPMFKAARSMAAGAPVPVEAGTMQLDATVNVTWSLK